MRSWYQQTPLLIVIACFVLSKQLSTIAAQKNQFKLTSNKNDLAIGVANQSKFLAYENFQCQNLDPTYQNVYSFETEDYYIDICQLGSNFYYHRQSKSNERDSVLIPAEAIFGGDVFQANAGKATYFVGKDGDRYYSSVMQNNSEIVFEPEIPISVASPSLNNGVRSVNVNNTNNSDSRTDASINQTQQSLICTRERSAFNPQLNGWQKLIGKSPDTANQYAIRNGHDFDYDDNSPSQALITTKDGAIINLDIATVDETINRVCVQPVAVNYR